ncbi:hypothetical protein Agub_g1470, partial [Astrephomene gubernaculifera]
MDAGTASTDTCDGGSPSFLLNYINSCAMGTKPCLIDVRDASKFIESRLRGSYNIPLEFLVPRMFILPDRATPLGLVVGGPPATQMVKGAAAAGGAKEDIQVAAFLKSRGWNVAFCVEATPELWRTAAEVGELETDGDAVLLQRRWPFQPSGLLTQQMERIEELLVTSRRAAEAGQAGGAASGAGSGGDGEVGEGVTSPVDGVPCVTLRALDVGCGSGRDLAWLSTRNPRIDVPSSQEAEKTEEVQVAWECVGLDSWHGALQRAAEVLSLGQVPAGRGGVTLHLVQIEGGLLKPLPLAPAKGSQREFLLRYLAGQHGSTVEGKEGDGEHGTAAAAAAAGAENGA